MGRGRGGGLVVVGRKRNLVEIEEGMGEDD